MEKAKLEYFEKILLSLRRDEIKNLNGAEDRIRVSQRDDSSDLSSYPIHSADLATDAESREEDAVLAGKESNIIDEIDRAMRKIARGKYGICENCGKEISEERLRQIPYARFCIRCKEKLFG
jgi:RNA polymerase-binding protein DksA